MVTCQSQFVRKSVKNRVSRAKSRSSTRDATFLLWVTHNLERAADRVTNICERVIFTVTGKMIELDLEDSGLESLA